MDHYGVQISVLLALDLGGNPSFPPPPQATRPCLLRYSHSSVVQTCLALTLLAGDPPPPRNPPEGGGDLLPQRRRRRRRLDLSPPPPSAWILAFVERTEILAGEWDLYEISVVGGAVQLLQQQRLSPPPRRAAAGTSSS